MKFSEVRKAIVNDYITIHNSTEMAVAFEHGCDVAEKYFLKRLSKLRKEYATRRKNLRGNGKRPRLTHSATETPLLPQGAKTIELL